MDADGNGSYHDDDDYSELRYGHGADAVIGRAITLLVRHYYTASAAGDGKVGCRLIYGYSLVAETAPEFAKARRAPKLTANTCAAVVSRLYRRRHSELADHLKELEVRRIGVYGENGMVILRFGSGPEYAINVRRVGQRWRIGLLFDHRLP